MIKYYDDYFIGYVNDPLAEVLSMANEPYRPVHFETSAENLAMWIFNKIRQKLPIVKIELAETKSSTVIYEQSIS